MILRGTDFGHVWQASGSTNFDEKGWWYHGRGLLRPLKPLIKMAGLDFRGSTFVSKTTTLKPREGNMPLKDDGMTPEEWMPRCIHVNRKTHAAVNAVGLSGPGLDFLLESGVWQKRTAPFFISLMSLAPTARERLAELSSCTLRLTNEKGKFKTPFGIQVNFSCPNGGINPADLIKEVKPCLDVLAMLEVPIAAKFGPDLSIEAALEIEKHPALDAFCVFNTIPWDKLPDNEKVQYFGSTTSPLVKHLGEKFKGGVSGEPLLRRVIDWIAAARKAGLKKPVNGGGGILSPYDAKCVMMAGANSVSLGSIAFLAPTQVGHTIRETIIWVREQERQRARMRTMKYEEPTEAEL